MANPMLSVENRRAIAELRSTLRQPTRGFNAWFRMIVGDVPVEEPQGRFLPDRVHHQVLADPAHDDR